MKKEGRIVDRLPVFLKDILIALDYYTSYKGDRKHIVSRIIKYTIIGVSCFLIDLLLLWFFTSYLGVYYLLSAGVSFLIAHSLNYTINKHWGFRDSKIKFLHGYWKFIFIGAIGVGLTVLLMYLLVDIWDVYYITARIIVAAVVSVFNFGSNLFFTFKIHKKQ